MAQKFDRTDPVVQTIKQAIAECSERYDVESCDRFLRDLIHFCETLRDEIGIDCDPTGAY